MKAVAVFAGVVLGVACMAQAEPPAGYKLVWSDEFNKSSLDTGEWTYRLGDRMLSAQKSENVSVSNGLLRIALKKEESGTLHYTAGGVISRREFLYGYFEARFRCPKPAGWHTSFWLMKDYWAKDAKAASKKGGAKVPGPKAQEIDVCEQDSVNNRSYSAGVFDWSGRSGKGKRATFGRAYYFQPTVPDFSADFHVWGCEFTPAAVKFYLDGKLTHETDATKFPHGPQNVWLTCIAALLGHPHAPKQVDDAGLPAYAEFDWVRVYEKDQAGQGQ